VAVAAELTLALAALEALAVVVLASNHKMALPEQLILEAVAVLLEVVVLLVVAQVALES